MFPMFLTRTLSKCYAEKDQGKIKDWFETAVYGHVQSPWLLPKHLWHSTGWKVAAHLYHFCEAPQQYFFYQEAIDAKSVFTSGDRAEIENVKCEIQFQLCHQRALFKCQYTFSIYMTTFERRPD